jgi:hypothetical protein
LRHSQASSRSGIRSDRRLAVALITTTGGWVVRAASFGAAWPPSDSQAAFVAFIDDRSSNRAPKGRDDGTMEVMTRVLATLLAVVPVLIGVAGCATHASGGSAGSPVGGGAASPADGSAAAAGVMPSRSAGAFIISAGGQNPEAAIPNPGTGAGNPLLARALLPQSSSGREAAFLLPPGVVALPDRDRRSLFIGLRQYSSPVIGPLACEGWTAGLWTVVVGSFNRPGVQLGVTEQNMPRPAGLPMFSEAIISGPPSVLDALADPPLPAACRDITTPPYPGGVRPIAAAAPDPGQGAVSARAFEVTGTGRFPVWQWAEVIQGRGFLLEIRIPNQSANPDPGAALTMIAANAYRRAAAVLAAPGG